MAGFDTGIRTTTRSSLGRSFGESRPLTYLLLKVLNIKPSRDTDGYIVGLTNQGKTVKIIMTEAANQAARASEFFNGSKPIGCHISPETQAQWIDSKTARGEEAYVVVEHTAYVGQQDGMSTFAASWISNIPSSIAGKLYKSAYLTARAVYDREKDSSRIAAIGAILSSKQDSHRPVSYGKNDVSKLADFIDAGVASERNFGFILQAVAPLAEPVAVYDKNNQIVGYQSLMVVETTDAITTVQQGEDENGDPVYSPLSGEYLKNTWKRFHAYVKENKESLLESVSAGGEQFKHNDQLLIEVIAFEWHWCGRNNKRWWIPKNAHEFNTLKRLTSTWSGLNYSQDPNEMNVTKNFNMACVGTLAIMGDSDKVEVLNGKKEVITEHYTAASGAWFNGWVNHINEAVLSYTVEPDSKQFTILNPVLKITEEQAKQITNSQEMKEVGELGDYDESSVEQSVEPVAPPAKRNTQTCEAVEDVSQPSPDTLPFDIPDEVPGWLNDDIPF